MLIKVLGICGSPRRRGNSEFLLQEALAGAKEASAGEVEVELYRISGKKYVPCDACFSCKKLGGECRWKDDFQELRDKWLAADAIIYSVPVYHMSVPGQLKCFIDRLGNSLYAHHKTALPFQFKTVAAIAQGGQFFCGQEHAMTDLINHAMTMGCIPVSGDKEYGYIGAAGCAFGGRGKESLRKNFEEGEESARVAVQSARTIGRHCVEIALFLLSGAKQHRDVVGAHYEYGTLAKRLGIPSDPIAALQGIGKGERLVEKLLAERRRDQARE
ncbi:MAG: flavodoxin family protein [Chloroflexi bacterium]|nr:flavodoxin family protein [Chloroflexota bacterium]